MKTADKKSKLVKEDESMTVHEGSDVEDMFFASDDDVSVETWISPEQMASHQVYGMLADLETGIQGVFAKKQSLEQT